MKGIHYTAKILISAAILIFVFSGCEYKAPTSMWNQDKAVPEKPVITSVTPADSSVGGDIEITISGEHFSPYDSVQNMVYFNATKARIKDASEDEIVVFRPNLVGDSLTIKVVVQNALEVVELPTPYKITSVLQDCKGFTPADELETIELDKDENIYSVLYDKMVIKMTPEGERSELGEMRFRAYDAKIGPDDYLYGACSKKVIYRVPLDSGEYQEYAEITDNVRYIDFDESGNLYAGGKQVGFFMIRPDASYISSGAYSHIDITTVRYYNGYFWVGGQYDEAGIPKWGVWRGQANGSISDPELVINSDQVPGYAEATVLSLTFSAAGDMLIGTDQEDPIILVKDNGEIQPLYYDILDPSADQLVWGNGNYLYMFDLESVKIVKIDMGQSGAPYYGRE